MKLRVKHLNYNSLILDILEKKNTYIYKLEKLRDQLQEELKRNLGQKVELEAEDPQKLAFRTEEAYK